MTRSIIRVMLELLGSFQYFPHWTTCRTTRRKQDFFRSGYISRDNVNNVPWHEWSHLSKQDHRGGDIIDEGDQILRA